MALAVALVAAAALAVPDRAAAQSPPSIQPGDTCGPETVSFDDPWIVCEQVVPEAAWVGVTNTGPAAMLAGWCDFENQPPQGPISGGECSNEYESNFVGMLPPGQSYVIPVPGLAGGCCNYWALLGGPDSGSDTTIAATVASVVPQDESSLPSLAAGQQCSSGTWYTGVECIPTGQFGAVKENSWVTFANPGTADIPKFNFIGLHGSSDTLDLPAGRIGYAGVGAGHTSNAEQLGWLYGDGAGGEITVASVIPEDYSGFSLQQGQTCTTANYISNPVNCAQSGQIGQTADSIQSVSLANNASNPAYVTGGEDSIVIDPGQSVGISFQPNVQLSLTCKTSDNKNCSTGSDAQAQVTSVNTAANAATVVPARREGRHKRVAVRDRRLAPKLRCVARQRRCLGKIRVLRPRRANSRAKRKTIARGTFDVAAGRRGRGAVELSRRQVKRLGERAELAIRTRQPKGKAIVTHRLLVDVMRG